MSHRSSPSYPHHHLRLGRMARVMVLRPVVVRPLRSVGLTITP